MKNKEIRKLINDNRIYYYEIAHIIGISEFTLSIWFRKELSAIKKEKIISAINTIKNSRK